MASTLGTLNPLRYRSYVYDTETELYYLQSRYYDPEICRFINADGYITTGGLLGNNMYVYCLNNPVNYVDAGGCSPILQTRYDTVMLYGGGGVGYVSIPQSKFGSFNGQTETGDGSFAVLSASKEVTYGTKTGEIIAGEFSGPSLGNDGLTILSASVKVVSLDLDTGNMELSLFDLGNGELSLGAKDWYPQATAMLSLWDPSVSFDLGDTVITFGLHVGAIGLEASLIPGNTVFGFANGIGGYIAIS